MLQAYWDYLEGAREILMEGRGVAAEDREPVLAAIGHALAFSTWRSLAREQGLADPAAVSLMACLVEAAASVVSSG